MSAGSDRGRALIAGGGLGGLAAAIALRQAGYEPRVFERAQRIEEIQVGAGLFVWPNAVRALQRVGVADAALGVASPAIEHFRMQTMDGRPLMDYPIGAISRQLDSRAVGVMRPELHGALVGSLRPGELELGRPVVDFEQDDRGVTVRLSDGGEMRGELLVGADGVDSTVRERVLGPTALRYAGYTSWRGTLDLGAVRVPPATFTKLWGRGARFLFYPVDETRLYWLALANAEKGGRDPEGGRRRAVLARYRGWLEPVEAMLEATDERAIHRQDIDDRDPVKRWGDRRVTLLGDAAHPMTPNIGQGACQALEDAVVLGSSLSSDRDPVAGLRAYERRRVGRATSFQRRSRLIGRAGRFESPVACGIRDRLLSLILSNRSPVMRKDTRDELKLEL